MPNTIWASVSSPSPPLTSLSSHSAFEESHKNLAEARAKVKLLLIASAQRRAQTVLDPGPALGDNDSFTLRLASSGNLRFRLKWVKPRHIGKILQLIELQG